MGIIVGKATWWFDGLLHVPKITGKVPGVFSPIFYHGAFRFSDFTNQSISRTSYGSFFEPRQRAWRKWIPQNLWHRKQEKQIQKTTWMVFWESRFLWCSSHFWTAKHRNWTHLRHPCVPRASGSAKVAPRRDGWVAPTEKKNMRIEVCYIGTTGVCWCFMGFIQNEGMLRVSCGVTMG